MTWKKQSRRLCFQCSKMSTFVHFRKSRIMKRTYPSSSSPRFRVHPDFPCIVQPVNQRPWNSHHRHTAAATDHPWLSSDTAIWSLGVRATSGSFGGFGCPFVSVLEAAYNLLLTNKNEYFQRSALSSRQQVNITLCLLSRSYFYQKKSISCLIPQYHASRTIQS